MKKKENLSFFEENKHKVVTIFVLAFLIVGVSYFNNGFQAGKLGITHVQAQDEKNEGGEGGENEGGEAEEGNTEYGAGELCGFAWGATSEGSRMGVGWVSFNSRDCDTNGDGSISTEEAGAIPGCPAGETARYNVTITDKNSLEGYAWSNNIGWLKFGGLSDMPKTSGNSDQDALIQSGGDLTGWARFCSGTMDGKCGSMDGRNDGWDGWVSLRDDKPQYGVHFDDKTGVFSGFSWGGPVVGWLNWSSDAGNGVRLCTNEKVTLKAFLTADPDRGQAKLNSQLEASYEYSLGADAKDVQYQFKCDYGGKDWSEPQDSNTYECSFEEPGTYYHPQVKVIIGSHEATAETEVRTDPEGKGSLGLGCSVSPKAGFINTPFVWRADLDPEDPQPASEYTYTFSFTDGQPNPAPIVTTAEFATVNRTYQTLGNKIMSVTVQDNLTSIQETCGTNANVIVRPVIIPI